MLGQRSWVGIGLMAVLAGCGPTILPEEDPANESSGDSGRPTTGPGPTPTPPSQTTGVPDPPPATSASTSGGADESGADDQSFIDGGPDVPPAVTCDFFEQDCPRGRKCVPVATGGSTAWNGLHCRDVVDEPAGLGEPCTHFGGRADPIDDCDLGSLCLTPGSSQGGEGHCVALCVGSLDDPVCDDPQSTCTIASEPPGFCLPSCDPLLQDCQGGQGCYVVGSTFSCAPDASMGGGTPGSPCEFINACAPGSACVAPSDVPGCDGAVGCCTAFCDLGDPTPPCLPGQACLPFDDGMPMTNPGLCGVP